MKKVFSILSIVLCLGFMCVFTTACGETGTLSCSVTTEVAVKAGQTVDQAFGTLKFTYTKTSADEESEKWASGTTKTFAEAKAAGMVVTGFSSALTQKPNGEIEDSSTRVATFSFNGCTCQVTYKVTKA